MGALLLAIDIGGTKTALMAADARTHEPLARERFETQTDASPEQTATTLELAVRELLGREGLQRRSLRAVGAAVPGQVDEKGNVLSAGKLGWKNAPFRRLLERAFDVPAFVEHDANAAALGERWKGHAANLDSFVFLALGTGLGAGIVLGGRLHRGHHHAAGEIGNMMLRRRTRWSDPHQQNLDKQLGSKAIKQRAGYPDHVPAKRVHQDPSKAELAERLADEVAAAIINICSVVDPALVVLGGGTATDALLERVRARVDEELDYRPRLERSALGEEAPLFGALQGALTAAPSRGARAAGRTRRRGR
jgi:glucokinase